MQFPIFNFEEGEVLLFDKPISWTSFDVVNKIRRTIRTKKVGHAGTLDPLATGLLVLCTGKMTKQIESIQATEKEYLATISLGKTTPSFDLETPFDSEKDISHLGPNEVEAIIKSFVGDQMQLPPMYSALKVDGKRLYQHARKGREIALKPRPVSIYSMDVVSFELPEIQILVRCSKGTYIRTLAHDIGQKLGVGAHLSALRRTKVGQLKVEDAYDIPTFVSHFNQIKPNTNSPQNP